MSLTDLDGRVAVVTGAGGGLGRQHALQLASQGAAVVVNDLASADGVVDEIRAAGGQAMVSTDGVHTWEGGRRIVDVAVEVFGRIDIVINNAGILRDTSFAKLSPEGLDAVLAVHLAGAFHVTHAAWPHMVEQGHGRVVMTTSGSGLYGNFGQSNYGAAKLGLVGLTRTLAIEGARKGITANAIAPLARSQMTEGVMPDELLARLDPSWVSPLVGWLSADACTDTGHVYSVAGGYYARVAVVEGPGVAFDTCPSPDDIAAARDQLTDLSSWVEPGSLADQMSLVADRATSHAPPSTTD